MIRFNLLLYVINNNFLYLYKHSKDDDADCGRDEKLPTANVVGQGIRQGERDGSSQAPVRQTKLVLHVEGDGPEGVDDLGQHQHT